MARHWLVLFCTFVGLNSSAVAVPLENWGYAGLGTGYSAFSVNRSNVINNFTQLSNAAAIENAGVSFHGFGGGYFDQYLGLEAEMLLAGSVIAKESGSAYKLFEVSNFNIVGVVAYPLNQNIKPFAKIGTHLWDVSLESSSEDSLGTGVGFTYGLGFDINIYGGKERQLRLQWNRYHYDNVFLSVGDIFSLAMLFTFGNSP